MNVYFISGLGADKRAFKKITLPDSFTPIHIDWIQPLKNETLMDYSLRLAQKIDTSQPFVLIGLSFGGIVVCELTKVLYPVKSIIISSVASNAQIPWYYKVIGKLGIHNLIPTAVFKSSNPITRWAFGAKTKEEKEILKQILSGINEQYLRWSINAIVKWNNDVVPNNIFHLHGTEDNIFPIRFTKPTVQINGGRHFMVISKHREVNGIINSELERLLEA